MRKRIVSSVIMLIIFIPLIILGKIPFALGVGLISILAFREISKLNNYPVIVYFLSFISLISIVYSNFDSHNLINGLNYKVISLALLLTLSPIVIYQVKNKYTIDDAFRLYAFIFLIGIGLNYLILIRDLDLKYFLYVLLITIFTDTFAYFGGSLVGKHKLTRLSPKKTIEGALIGTIMSTFIMSIYYVTIIGGNYNLLLVILFTLLLSIIGQIGDLFFSAIKRHYEIKDFSNLIPGHGGILDRFDSLIFVAIAFILFIKYM